MKSAPADMGITYADIEPVRGVDLVLFQEGYLQEDQISRVTVKALADRGASMLAIPESVREQLNLRKIDEQQAELADGSLVQFAGVGTIEIKFENRRTIEYAIGVPNSPDMLLGAHPM